MNGPVIVIQTALFTRDYNYGVAYSAAQIYPNQNIRIIRVSPIRVYAYAYMYTQIRIYSVCAYASLEGGGTE